MGRNKPKQRNVASATARRQEEWAASARALVAAGLPMTILITITWSKCMEAERRAGHWLDRSESDRVSMLWDRLRRLARECGLDRFIAARAPEYDATMGVHLHLAVHVPDEAIPGVVDLVERCTGAPRQACCLPHGKTIRHGGRSLHGVLAMGDADAWMIQRNTRPFEGGTEFILEYMAKGPRSAEVGTQFRLSNDLIALTRAATVERVPAPPLGTTRKDALSMSMTRNMGNEVQA